MGIITILGLLILSFLPNLLAVYNAPFYRCICALATIILLLLIWSLKVCLELIFKIDASRYFNVFIVLACLFAGIYAFQTIHAYRVIPSKVELAYIMNIIKQREKSGQEYHTTHMILASREEMPSRYDEFGVLSSSYDGNVQFLFKVAFRELGIEDKLYNGSVNFSYSYPGQAVLFKEDVLYFDMNALAHELGKKIIF